MESLRDLLMMGPGPSSSHTIGPYRIAMDFVSSLKGEKIRKLNFTLFGSLALTGKGHGTDSIILEAMKDYDVEVDFDFRVDGIPHPNTVKCVAILDNGKKIEETYMSIGGGSFSKAGSKRKPSNVYPFDSFSKMTAYMMANNIDDIYDVVERFEGKSILKYAKTLLKSSFETIERSLQYSGVLPGPLHLKAVAKEILEKSKLEKDPGSRAAMTLSAYAYATAEANARGEIVVTAPTCGAAGVVPALFYYAKSNIHSGLEQLAKAYLVGALMCEFIKTNASVSGALLGCQAEIGSAASFGAAGLAYLSGLSTHQIEYAAEVAMEHFLGLTCDPVNGYVQIPCIERNGIAAVHAWSAYLYAKNIEPIRTNKVSFDTVIKVMNETGSVMNQDLRETAVGGLAKFVSC